MSDSKNSGGSIWYLIWPTTIVVVVLFGSWFGELSRYGHWLKAAYGYDMRE